MDIQAQKQLYDLSKAGYSIEISSGFVDSLVHSVELLVDNTGNDYYCYSSQVFEQQPLDKIPVWKVKVYKQVENWLKE